mmetsp:Transcript_11054/g.44511  ORF Transcript_11054/g.44511 Transcript_11054/m.44511 type:complete len:249 (+) Transcript_11054:1437-2183(+)
MLHAHGVHAIDHHVEHGPGLLPSLHPERRHRARRGPPGPASPFALPVRRVALPVPTVVVVVLVVVLDVPHAVAVLEARVGEHARARSLVAPAGSPRPAAPGAAVSRVHHLLAHHDVGLEPDLARRSTLGAVQHVLLVRGRELVDGVGHHIVDGDGVRDVVEHSFRAHPRVHAPGERLQHEGSGDDHLDADEHVLQRPTVGARLQHPVGDQYGAHDALPKGEEDDRLDEHELHHRLVRFEQVVRAKVEE